MKLHWSLVLNTQDKTKASRILRLMELYENLVVEKFIEPSSSGVKAYLDVALIGEWPAVAVEALRNVAAVGVPFTVFIHPDDTVIGLEGVISTPSMVGVTWAGWSLIP